MKGNGLGDEGIKILSQVLKVNTTIISLDLRGLYFIYNEMSTVLTS